MIQSGKYIFAPDFVGYNKKLDLGETEVLWDIVHFPESATIDTILKIVFDPRAYGSKVTILLMIIIIQNIIGYIKYLLLQPPNRRYHLGVNRQMIEDAHDAAAVIHEDQQPPGILPSMGTATSENNCHGRIPLQRSYSCSNFFPLNNQSESYPTIIFIFLERSNLVYHRGHALFHTISKRRNSSR